MSTDPDQLRKASDALRAGSLAILDSDVSLGVVLDPEQQQALALLEQLTDHIALAEATWVVADDAGLNRVVPNMPEQAWDLFDLEEQPLTLRLVVGSAFSKRFVDEQGYARVRKLRSSTLFVLCRRIRKPLLFVPLKKPDQNAEPILQAIENAVFLPPLQKWQGLREKEIRLGPRGEIEIIRS